MTASSAIALIKSLLDDAVGSRLAGDLAARPVAVGWATVELDRAAEELAAAYLLPGAGQLVEAPSSAVLGAFCRMADDALADGVTLLLLEPSTEGRLAASLARSGEGPVAVWLAVPDLTVAVADLGASGITTTTEGPGPLGPERLVLGGAVHGPHRLLVGLPGTIHP